MNRRRALGGAVLACALVIGVQGTEGKKYGEGVSLAFATPIGDVLAKPEGYVGKTIRVDGEVAAVCEEMGCWIELRAPGGDKGLRFKVEDGVIVFPITAKGRRASAEGTLERIDVAAGASEHDAMHADQTGKASPSGKAIYQVKATGAVIY